MSTARFDEFTTVDWVDDGAKEQQRQQRLPRAWVHLAYDAAVSWMVVVVVGALIGVNTAFISIVTEWLSDLKLGVCTTGWWLNEEFCCWEEPGSSCAQWATWDQLLLGRHAAVVRWLGFVAVGTGVATLCAWLVRAYAPMAAGSGLPEIKATLSGYSVRGFMGGWTLLMKSIGLAMAVASGLSVGKEGPAVHMGCCVGNVVSRNFAKYRASASRRREIVSASAAAGVAVAFGAPIGGVLFSLEDLSSHFPRKTLWRSFLCALVATVSLQAMNPFWTGKLVMFQATYDRDWHFFEILFFVLLGVFGGVYGGLCIRLNLRVAALRKRHSATLGAVREVAILALATTAVTHTNSYTRKDMGELLSELLQECGSPGSSSRLCMPAHATSVVWALFWATAIRSAGTVLAYGCKVPCGIFVPSMAIGASFGRMLGTVVQMAHNAHPKWRVFAQCAPDTPCITPATYAFLGAAAAMSGVTKVTVAVVVIMYELTGAINFIVPTMIVVMVAKVVGDMLVEGGISEQLMLLNGLPFVEEADNQPLLLDKPAAALMHAADDSHVLPASGLPASELQRILDAASATAIRGFPVVDNLHDMRLVGYVSHSNIVNELAETPLLSRSVVSFGGARELSDLSEAATVSLAHIVNTSPVTVRPRTSAETTAEIFRKLGPRVILVTSEDDGQLVGLVTRKDVLRYTRSTNND
ncbi:glycerol ethanol, ferric requiring protein [Coemansia sp. RSA 1813]|nr:glycerol ethanol, ferric requiring protein [Coemansia sp. RSA 1646]KAJ1769073.1 glycerol ethanol, ferric requiring protein [Coemansia sp. RSA 1843]KAJ2086895.1 glycerol ethanol, ferric requiring protein [Coemansia sp. RSA 986]KAJ2211667.1 glycerol ethanol, ferric requiring protein [Coemansia sp. RSA 487]KAJ2565380.1 glycerol ethanol, ferric requiring protein [Coemansia sp. RSA 1813]